MNILPFPSLLFKWSKALKPHHFVFCFFFFPPDFKVSRGLFVSFWNRSRTQIIWIKINCANTKPPFSLNDFLPQSIPRIGEPRTSSTKKKQSSVSNRLFVVASKSFANVQSVSVLVWLAWKVGRSTPLLFHEISCGYGRTSNFLPFK